MTLLREELGEILREIRLDQGRTLREVAASCAVSFGYLSEIERGAKEASSECLNAICHGLGLPVSEVLDQLATRFERAEAASAPVPLPVATRASVRASAA